MFRVSSLKPRKRPPFWTWVGIILFGIHAHVAADAPAQWQWRNPRPQGNSLAGVTYAGGTFIAVGDDGTTLTSPDGTTWSIQKAITQAHLAAVTYANGTSVAVGGAYASPVNLTSANTVNWVISTPTDATAPLHSVVFGNGTFVAVGDTIETSSDGSHWSGYSQLVPNLGGYQAVAYGNGVFVAVGGSGVAMKSVDPATWWDATSSGTSRNLAGVTYGQNQFVAVGDAGVILTSADGNQWSPQTSGTSASFYGVTYGNGLYVAVGATGVILTSPDGGTWTNRSVGGDLAIRGVAYGGGHFVAVGDAGLILTSTDGQHWTRVDSGPRTSLSALTRGPNLFVGVGEAGTILTSPDGATWTSRDSGTTNALFGIAAGNHNYVAVGSSGTILFSRGGTNWESESPGIHNDLHGIAYGGGVFVALGKHAPALTSPDGIAWTMNSDTNVAVSDLLNVTYSNGLFVAVGGEYTPTRVPLIGYGPILTSADGVHWSFSATGHSLNGVSYGDGMFVTVGDAGTWTSADGNQWTYQPSGTGGSSVVFGNGWFVTVGGNGTMSTSPDGTNWTTRSSGTGWNLNGVTFGDGTFVAVGASGTVLQSGNSVSSITNLPALWLDQDIGEVGAAGSASFANGTFTVQGSGADIWGSQDAFHFVYQPLTNKGAYLVARVTGLQASDPWAKAGVMIRQSLAPGSPQAMMILSSGNGAAFQYRISSNNPSYSLGGAATATAPYWVALVRVDTDFTGYQSVDGSNWVEVGSATIPMSDQVYVGLAVTAHTNSVLTTATFDHVEAVPSPTITDFQVTSSTVTNGASFTFTYTVADTGGPGLAQVELWRASGSGTLNDPTWVAVQTNLASGLGPITGSFTDMPINPGHYWYGLEAADTEGDYVDNVEDGVASIQVNVMAGQSALVLSSHLSGHTLTLSVPTAAGVSYTLEYKNSLADPTWTTLQTQPGNGGAIIFSEDTTTVPVRFYRIRSQ